MRTINKHIIHCSDSNFGAVDIIRHWHLSRGFKDIGYHFVIRQDGEIEVGRMLDEIGAHCAGENYDSIGTCLIGDGEFTTAQFKSLRRLDKSLKRLFPQLKTYPHNKFNPNKTCPIFNVKKVLEAE